MSDEEDSDESGIWDSGPYCRHWCHAPDCEFTCATCGSGCIEHNDEDCEWQD